MKKSLISLMIGLLMLGVGGNVWAESSGGGLSNGHTAEDLQCSGCVNDTDIATGAVTNSKIADGSITDAKIGGTISASKIEKPANVVVVAKSGGDYTSINVALAAINPTASNPYVIKVMPGRYEENDIVMKSYVHLQGAGKDVTTVSSRYYSIFVCSAVTNVIISGFTITASSYGAGIPGITIGNSTFVTIENNHFTGIGLNGIHDTGSTATTVIRGNIFSDMRSYYNRGIEVGEYGYPFQPSSPVITGNLFKGNWAGIRASNGSPIISNNVFTENDHGIKAGAGTFKDNMFTGNTVGLAIDGGSPLILSNKSTGNDCDIRIYGASPMMSYNVFDTLCGVSGIPAGGYAGKYNLKSDGTDAPTTDTFQ